MKKIIAAALCLMLVISCIGALAEGGMVDFAGCGAALFTDGIPGADTGRILPLEDGSEIFEGSGIYGAACVYAPGTEEQKPDSEERGSGITLFAIRSGDAGTTPEKAGEDLSEQIAGGALSAGIEIGQTGDRVYYLYAGNPRVNAPEGTAEEELAAAEGMIGEITAHPEYFCFKNPGEHTYCVRITDPEGQPVQGAFLSFCTDDMCKPGPTGADGRALFHSAVDSCHVQVLQVPEGYVYNGGELLLTTGNNVVTINLNLKN